MYHFVNEEITILTSILFAFYFYFFIGINTSTYCNFRLLMYDFFKDPRAQCVKAAQLRRGQEQASQKESAMHHIVLPKK